MKPGISAYFNQDKIRIRFRTLEDLNYPEYIHFLIDEKKKHMFIEKCKRDLDAFRIDYRNRKSVKNGNGGNDSVQSETEDGCRRRIHEQSVYLHEKRFLDYLARVIGVPRNSQSLRFNGKLQKDGRIFIDLNEYTVIKYTKQFALNSGKRE